MAVVRVDLHVHSAASMDCRVEPAAVAAHCRRLGLGPVVLTDHDTIDGALALREVEPANVVVGQEVTTTEGELIGLFLEEAIPARLPPDETVRRIRAQGGLVYLQHPYDAWRRCLRESAIERLAGDIDVVEVFNARSPETANRRAEELCATLRAAAGAGSDAHTLPELGSAYVEMEAFHGPADFLAKLDRARIVRRPSRLGLAVTARLRRQR